MSHFYGTLRGARGEATRTGTKSSGIETHAASWRGAIRTFVYQDEHGRDCFRVEEVTWKGAGQYRLIAEGILGDRS